jgi:hypothetical protein
MILSQFPTRKTILLDDSPLSGGINHVALLNNQRLEDEDNELMVPNGAVDCAPHYLPPILMPKLTLCYKRFCRFNRVDQDSVESLKLFWSFYTANSRPWPELDLKYTPPEVDGLTLEQGIKYMADNFPYPAVEHVFDKLMVFADLFMGTTYDCDQYNVGYAFGQANVNVRTVSNSYIIVIKSLKDVVRRCQFFKVLFEDIKSRFSCFYVVHNEGNLSIAMFAYAPICAPLVEDC